MSCEYYDNIPMYNEYSSLNSILMASLYSENSRDMIIKNAKKWDSSNKYKLLIKRIVNKNKRQLDILKELYLLNPDEIFIDNMFFLKDSSNKQKFGKELTESGLKKINWIDDFIIDFYRSLDISCLDIYKINDNCYLNLYKFIGWKLIKDEKYSTELNISSFLKIKENKMIPKNPDVLIVFDNELNKSIKKNYIDPFVATISKSGNEENKFKRYLEQVFVSEDKYNIDINDEEVITLNGEEYILDSILLRFGDKSVVGFKCNGEKYVYNNFSSSTESPCSVIKFDWKYNKGNYCYNPDKCELEYDNMKDIKELCFDFNEGNKTLIYIKKNKDNVVIPDIPDSNILEIIMKIKAMTNTELMNEFNKYKKILSSDDKKPIFTRELMEKTLLRDYMIDYIKKLKEEPEPEPEVEVEEIPKSAE
jgi:hypothetical protein